MDKKFKAKWLKALRSRKYKQARELLRSKRGGFCCLGVLCDVVNPNGWRNLDDKFFTNAYAYKDFASDCVLPANLRMRLCIRAGQQNTLTKLNDSKRWNFKRIADWIEKNL